MQNSGRKTSHINLPIFLLAALIEVFCLTLLRLSIVDCGLDDISVIGVGLLYFSFWTSGIVIGLRCIYLSRNYIYFPFADFLGNALLLAVIGIISTQIIYLDTGRKYEFNLHNTSPIDSITVKGGIPGSGPIISQINDPNRVQKIVNFVNGRGKRWRLFFSDTVFAHVTIEFNHNGAEHRSMGADGNTLINESLGQRQYYVELTPEEAKYFYDLLGAAP
jgi:hypothetical protein